MNTDEMNKNLDMENILNLMKLEINMLHSRISELEDREDKTNTRLAHLEDNKTYYRKIKCDRVEEPTDKPFFSGGKGYEGGIKNDWVKQGVLK